MTEPKIRKVTLSGSSVGDGVVFVGARTCESCSALLADGATAAERHLEWHRALRLGIAAHTATPLDRLLTDT